MANANPLKCYISRFEWDPETDQTLPNQNADCRPCCLTPGGILYKKLLLSTFVSGTSIIQCPDGNNLMRTTGNNPMRTNGNNLMTNGNNLMRTNGNHHNMRTTGNNPVRTNGSTRINFGGGGRGDPRGGGGGERGQPRGGGGARPRAGQARGGGGNFGQ